jgi:putative DNA methylase
MTYPIKSPRKLIEVALPLDAINTEAAREKSIRHGHPSTLHLWWARRPLAVARAVIFAQFVNDPGYQQGGGFRYGKKKKEAADERKRLFKIIEDLVLWDNTTNEEVLKQARAEIARSWREVCELNKDHPQATDLFNPDKLPALHDPFAGGGTIPLEAQRLGLEAKASDLNPVAVLINKAMIEIPPRFAGRPPVSLADQTHQSFAVDLGWQRHWPGMSGLAQDIRYYAAWMQREARERIGHLYPPVEIITEMARESPGLKPLVGQKVTVIAWLWARTVKSPNPAFSHADVPLTSSFVLCSKQGQEVYVQPILANDSYRFMVKVGTPPPQAQTGTKLGRGANFRCLLSDTPIDRNYIQAEFVAKRTGARLMAVVVEGTAGRAYIAPTSQMEVVAHAASPKWRPDAEMNQDSQDLLSGRGYGFKHWHELFTPRQLVALTTLSDLVREAHERVREDALAAGLSDDSLGVDAGGTGATAYADALAVYLGFCLDKATLTNTTQATWQKDPDRLTQAFGRQAIPMIWDYAEANPLSEAGGGFGITAHAVAKVLERLPTASNPGTAVQEDAASKTKSAHLQVVSTDPPYYNNISYADLSDYFYVWLRPTLKQIFPALFATLSVPKHEELVATPHRHGGKEKAEAFFLEGMTRAMHSLAIHAHPAFPITIYYAFKQSESEKDGTASTGWETFLQAVIKAGFAITGTWPMRTELVGNLKKKVSALASSVVLVCRQRPTDAPTISRREFLRELNAVLPEALDEMTKGAGDDRSPVAPVDLSQAIIGPGMAVFSKYAAVLEADGSPMGVRTALQLINRFLAEDDFDPDTQFCLHWFEQNGWKEGRFGDADTLSRAKGTSVNGVKGAGVVESGGGVVRLRRWSEYPAGWNPETDMRNPVWETLHQLIRALKQEGEPGAGRVLAAVKGKAEAARQLAYRLYTLCERQGWAEDARAYNELITSWTGIESAAGAAPTEKQSNLFE